MRQARGPLRHGRDQPDRDGAGLQLGRDVVEDAGDALAGQLQSGNGDDGDQRDDERVFDECLALLATALQEFPNDSELKKLQETAKADQAEQVKLRQMAEVRKLLGQQNFDGARKALEALAKDYPQDTAVRNLQNLALQEENEQMRQKRLDTEVAALRVLLGGGKFKQVVLKGEPLLQEYPQDYELKELVNFARGEVAQQDQKKKEEEREKQIQGFLMCER